MFIFGRNVMYFIRLVKNMQIYFDMPTCRLENICQYLKTKNALIRNINTNFNIIFAGVTYILISRLVCCPNELLQIGFFAIIKFRF